MLGTRVTHTAIARGSLANLNESLGRSQMYQEQLTSGKRIQRPSDDPTGTISALQHRASKRGLEQFQRNAQDGLGWLSTADSALQKAVASTRTAYTKLVAAANQGAMSDEGKQAIASELSGLRDNILTLANTKYGSRPVFGGTNNQTVAFDASGTYVGGNGSVNRQISKTESIQVNVNGNNTFSYDDGGGAQTFYEIIDEAIAALTAGSTPAVYNAAMETAIEKVQGLQTNMSNALSSAGTRFTRLETTVGDAQDHALELQTRIAEIESIDLAETIMQMQLQEVAHKAALGATAKAMQPTLMDFLR